MSNNNKNNCTIIMHYITKNSETSTKDSELPLYNRTWKFAVLCSVVTSDGH